MDQAASVVLKSELPDQNRRFRQLVETMSVGLKDMWYANSVILRSTCDDYKTKTFH